LGAEALAMLDRIQTLIDRSLQDKEAEAAAKSKGLAGAGKVMISRADLNEMRSEVGQVKTMLQTVVGK
jgi:hypothetical protein